MSPKNLDRFTYRVTWSPEDGEFLALCAAFPSLSWLATAPEPALAGIRKGVAEAVADMRANSKIPPTPLGGKGYSGGFRVRIPPHVHRALALEAAERDISLNRLAS